MEFNFDDPLDPRDSTSETPSFQDRILSASAVISDALELIKAEPNMTHSQKWFSLSGLARSHPNNPALKTLMEMYVQELMSISSEDYGRLWCTISPTLSRREIRLWRPRCSDNERFARYRGYNLLGPNYDLPHREFERRIIDSLIVPGGALDLLKTRQEMTSSEKWGTVSLLVRANPTCPLLRNLRTEYVADLKNITRSEFRDLWVKVRDELNDEERQLWMGNQTAYIFQWFLGIICTLILAGYALHSTGLYSRDDAYKLAATQSFFALLIVMIWVYISS